MILMDILTGVRLVGRKVLTIRHETTSPSTQARARWATKRRNRLWEFDKATETASDDEMCMDEHGLKATERSSTNERTVRAMPGAVKILGGSSLMLRDDCSNRKGGMLPKAFREQDRHNEKSECYCRT